MAGGQSELYFRNHRKTERGGLPQPRSTSFSHRQYPCLGDAEASGLSLDAADVSLQWVVLPLDCSNVEWKNDLFKKYRYKKNF